MISKFKAFTKSVKKELRMYKFILKDPRTPLFPKLLLVIAIGYLLSPVDIIPDFIPIFGQLDDVIIVPALVYFSLRLIPKNIIEENRSKINELNSA